MQFPDKMVMQRQVAEITHGDEQTFETVVYSFAPMKVKAQILEGKEERKKLQFNELHDVHVTTFVLQNMEGDVEDTNIVPLSRREGPTTQMPQKAIEPPKIGFIDKLADVPLITQQKLATSGLRSDCREECVRTKAQTTGHLHLHVHGSWSRLCKRLASSRKSSYCRGPPNRWMTPPFRGQMKES